jgi:hypothetical protein
VDKYVGCNLMSFVIFRCCRKCVVDGVLVIKKEREPFFGCVKDGVVV